MKRTVYVRLLIQQWYFQRMKIGWMVEKLEQTLFSWPYNLKNLCTLNVFVLCGKRQKIVTTKKLYFLEVTTKVRNIFVCWIFPLRTVGKLVKSSKQRKIPKSRDKKATRRKLFWNYFFFFLQQSSHLNIKVSFFTSWIFFVSFFFVWQAKRENVHKLLQRELRKNKA